MTGLMGPPPAPPMTRSTMTGLMAATGTAEDLLDDDRADGSATGTADDLLDDDRADGSDTGTDDLLDDDRAAGRHRHRRRPARR